VGETLTLRVRRRGELREVRVTASGAAPQPGRPSLGLTLRARTRIGAEAVRVDSGSTAERAGLVAGDVITQVGELPAPTPAQVLRSFASLGQGQRVLLAVTRGDAHFVTALER
jgi:S1-C subfamily serine protease